MEVTLAMPHRLTDGRLRWVLVFYVFLMGSVAAFTRVNISVAAPAMQSEYHLTNVQLGWIFSAFVLGYAFFQAPCGRLADRFGPRLTIGLGVIWWGVFTSGTALVPPGLAMALAAIIAVRFFLGVGEAIVYPAANRLVAAWIPSRERGIANGIIFGGVGAGGAVTPPLIAYIMMNWGWRWSFHVSALLSVLVGAGWYLLARDTPKEHPLISQAELERIEAGLPPAAPRTARAKALPWSVIIKDRNVLALTISYFCLGYGFYIFTTWFFSYLNKVRGLDLKASAMYSILPFIAMGIASPLGGAASDFLSARFGKRIGRCSVGIIGLGLSAVLLAVATQVESARLATVVLAGGAGAICLAMGVYWAVTADIASGSAGSASGLMNMGCQLGGALTASLTPFLADHFGWTASFLVAAGFSAAGAAAWLWVDPAIPLGGKARQGETGS
jgi:MFS transporter, ACS family, glucarate transporter